MLISSDLQNFRDYQFSLDELYFITNLCLDNAVLYVKGNLVISQSKKWNENVCRPDEVSIYIYENGNTKTQELVPSSSVSLNEFTAWVSVFSSWYLFRSDETAHLMTFVLYSRVRLFSKRRKHYLCLIPTYYCCFFCRRIYAIWLVVGCKYTVRFWKPFGRCFFRNLCMMTGLLSSQYYFCKRTVHSDD